MSHETLVASTAPFKFLDPYGPEDGDLFFGRAAEVADLYTKIYSAAITVLYGESGTGKTSLIQCGLRNRIPREDMLFVSVRTAGDPGAAVRAALLRAAPQVPDAGEDLADLLRRVIRRSYKTVLLVFDQFEEFLLFQTEDVRRGFAAQLAGWLDGGLNLRLLFAIRQEYLAQLTALEPDLPGLYENRIWLRRMAREQAEEVIIGPCTKAGVSIDPDLVSSLLDVLNSSGQGIDLPTLQVVLDSLYRQAVVSSDSAPILSYQDYQALGKIHSILGRFLDERVAALEERAESARQVLKTLVSAEATRRPAAQEEIGRRLARDFRVQLPAAELTGLLNTLVQQRILRQDPDSHCYELRHDSLAPQVRGWMSVLERELETLRESLEHRFREYQRNQRLLDAQVLADLAPYEGRLLLEDALAQYVYSSKEALRSEETRQREQAMARTKHQHRVIIGVAGAFCLVVAVFGAFSFFQWQEAEGQKQKAESQRSTAVAALEKLKIAQDELLQAKGVAEQNFSNLRKLVDDFTQVSESDLRGKPGMEPLRRELLEKILAYYQDMSEQRAGDATIAADMGEILISVGNLRRQLNEPKPAEDAYRRAIKILAELSLQHPDTPAYTRQLAMSYNALGFLPNEVISEGEAAAVLQQARALRAILSASYPDDLQIQSELAASLNNLGLFLVEHQQNADAEQEYLRAITIRERLVSLAPDNQIYQSDLGKSYNNLAVFLVAVRRNGEAELPYRKALEIRGRLVREHPEVPEYSRALAKSEINLGELLKSNRKLSEARSLYQQAVEILERLVSGHPGVPDYIADLQRSRKAFSHILSLTGDKVAAAKQRKIAEDFERQVTYGTPGRILVYSANGQCVSSSAQRSRR